MQDNVDLTRYPESLLGIPENVSHHLAKKIFAGGATKHKMCGNKQFMEMQLAQKLCGY